MIAEADLSFQGIYVPKRIPNKKKRNEVSSDR